MDDVVKLNEYVIVQRQNFMKFHKLTAKGMECRLGKFTIDLTNVVGKPFWSAYKFEPSTKGKNLFNLVQSKSTVTFSDEMLKNTGSGIDNRDIKDDGRSQKLSTVEIVGLRDKGLSAEAIVGTLIENSKTFASKTEYSQEKYLKKKEKKYSEHITIRKPTLRLVTEIVIGKGTCKQQLGLRMDTLAQITTVACVRPGGIYVLFESGCQGLVSAAVLNALGPEGTIVQVHAGNFADKHAIKALNLPQERTDQILTINIQNLVRRPASNRVATPEKVLEVEEGESSELGKRKAEDNSGNERKRARWEESEDKAKALLEEQLADGLIVVGKEHPSAILKKLLNFLKPSRPFVIFSSIREPLQEIFVDFKMRSDVIALRLTESWLRSYQVLPDRTHPDINMSGSGGYLLSGIKVSS